MPYSDSNYCQIHMTTVSEGLYQKLTEKDVQFGLLDMKEQALLDFRMTNEADALFGVKQQIVDPISRKVKYMSDGMLRKIDKRLDMGTESKITNDLIYGWASDIFCGNNGSERRVMFYGKDFGRQIAGASTVVKQLEAGNTEVVFGITFHRIATPDGELLMKPHDLLNEYGYSKAAIVIDPANIYRAERKPLEATELERDKVGLSRSTDVRIDESHTLAVLNPDLCCLNRPTTWLHSMYSTTRNTAHPSAFGTDGWKRYVSSRRFTSAVSAKAPIPPPIRRLSKLSKNIMPTELLSGKRNRPQRPTLRHRTTYPSIWKRYCPTLTTRFGRKP